MHVAHFHPPRALAATLLAAILAIVITLAVAAGLNDRSVGSAVSPSRSAFVPRLVSSPPRALHSTATPIGPASAWVTSPFSPLLGAPITPPWSVGRGS